MGLALLVGAGTESECNPLCPLPPRRHHLCRSRRYCRDVGNCVETLYTQVERLVQQAGKQADSSVSLYYFNASLYLLRVLKGNTADRSMNKTQKEKAEKAGTNTSTEPRGPEVSRPWPRKAQPRKSSGDRWEHIPGSRPGPSAHFSDGELRP